MEITNSLPINHQIATKPFQNYVFELIDSLSCAHRTFLQMSSREKESSEKLKKGYLHHMETSAEYQKLGGVPTLTAAVMSIAASVLMKNQGYQEVTTKLITEQVFPGLGGTGAAYCQGRTSEASSVATLKLEEFRAKSADSNSTVKQKIEELLTQALRLTPEVTNKG